VSFFVSSLKFVWALWNRFFDDSLKTSVMIPLKWFNRKWKNTLYLIFWSLSVWNY